MSTWADQVMRRNIEQYQQNLGVPVTFSQNTQNGVTNYSAQPQYTIGNQPVSQEVYQQAYPSSGQQTPTGTGGNTNPFMNGVQIDPNANVGDQFFQNGQPMRWVDPSKGIYEAMNNNINQVNSGVQQAMDLLGQGIQPAQQSTDEQIANINAAKATQLGMANQQFGAQTQNFQNQQGLQNQQYQNASDQARQQVAELMQGIQSRYGGTTQEGRFASEILGRQGVQSQAQLNQTHQNNMLQISQKLGQIEDVKRLALQDIEEKSATQINAAKQWLQDTLGSIRSNQATLQSHKADLAYAAMSQYQQYLEQVNMSKMNLQSSLAQQAQAAQLGLYGALNRGSQIQYNPGAYTTNGLGIHGLGEFNAPSNFSQAGGQPGVVPRRPEDQSSQ